MSEMFPALEDAVWDLVEHDCGTTRFYVDNRDKAGFLIISKWSALNSSKQHELMMNGVGLIKRFKTEREAKNRLKQIVENANIPVRVYEDKRNKRVLFAENTTERIGKIKTGCSFKVFEIPEWGELQGARIPSRSTSREKWEG